MIGRPSPVAPYLAGLRLAGRRVVVVGGGRVASRRVLALLTAQAVIEVVSPRVTSAIRRSAAAGELTWTPRRYADGDLADAWYVVCAVDDPAASAAVSVEAERRRVFCVRADDRHAATAWTPATAEVDGVSVGVLSGGDPRRSRSVRDLLAGVLEDAVRAATRRRAA